MLQKKREKLLSIHDFLQLLNSDNNSNIYCDGMEGEENFYLFSGVKESNK